MVHVRVVQRGKKEGDRKIVRQGAGSKYRRGKKESKGGSKGDHLPRLPRPPKIPTFEVTRTPWYCVNKIRAGLLRAWHKVVSIFVWVHIGIEQRGSVCAGKEGKGIVNNNNQHQLPGWGRDRREHHHIQTRWEVAPRWFPDDSWEVKTKCGDDIVMTMMALALALVLALALDLALVFWRLVFLYTLQRYTLGT